MEDPIDHQLLRKGLVDIPRKNKAPLLEKNEMVPSAQQASNLRPHSQGAQAMALTEDCNSKLIASCHSPLLTSLQMLTWAI